MEITAELQTLATFTAGPLPVISVYLNTQWRDQAPAGSHHDLFRAPPAPGTGTGARDGDDTPEPGARSRAADPLGPAASPEPGRKRYARGGAVRLRWGRPVGGIPLKPRQNPIYKNGE